MIIAEKGKRYDPDLVDTFMEFIGTKIKDMN